MEGKRKRVFFMIKLCAIIILSLWLIVFIAHKLLTHSELKKMAAAGVYNPVTIENYDLNVYLYGSENGSHTIVPMSGQGVNTFSMSIKGVTDKFAEKNRIAVVDRAGYGLSDSTNTPQTVDRIVDDYRTALKRAGCNAPYILLAHSISGLYASYWQSVHPEEIEGILFLEGSMPNFDYIDHSSPFHELFLTAMCNTGLQRLFHDSMKGEISYRSLKMQEQKFAKAMEMHSTYTYAQHSESVLFIENCRKTLNVMQKTNIPKIYVYCQPDNFDETKEYLEYKNKTYEFYGKKPPYDLNNDAIIDRMANEFMDSNIDMLQYLSEFSSYIGNCKIEHVAGIHNIYKQKPSEIAALLAELIKTIEK